MSKHGPDSGCEHCAGWRKLAETIVCADGTCKVCQGWGWTIGCPGCGKIWGKLKPKELP